MTGPIIYTVLDDRGFPVPGLENLASWVEAAGAASGLTRSTRRLHTVDRREADETRTA